MNDIINSMQSSRISAGWTPDDILKELESCCDRLTDIKAQLLIEQQHYATLKTALSLCLQDCHEILNCNKSWQKVQEEHDTIEN